MSTSTFHASALYGLAGNPAAPPDVLLRWLWPEAGAATRVAWRANLPDEVTDAVVEHEDPGLRRFAVRAPDASAELLDRLSRDEVDYVRGMAAGDERLPVARMVELLEDKGAARYAAQNPALPPAVMRRLLDVAGVPPAGGATPPAACSP